VNSTKGKQIPK